MVDGDETIHSPMVEYFRNVTRMFTAVKSAEEGLPLLEGPMWDIIVCNLKLPGINGVEFSKLVNQQRPGTKIVLVTHYPNPNLGTRIADYGIVEILTAPLKPERLISSIFSLYSSAHAKQIPAPQEEKASFDVPETVSIQELDESMIIKSYVRFGKRYQALSSQTCRWLQLNFKGTRARVNRIGYQVDISIEKIEPGDKLIKLHQFPIALMNLTFVRKKLIKELKKLGFLAFEVKRKPTEQSINQQIHLEAINRANQFIGEVNESIAVRDMAGETIRELISGDSQDEIDTFDLVCHVDNIVESGTAKAISVIAALKRSDRTYTHCIDVGAIFLRVYLDLVKAKRMANRFNNEAEILLSAILHDIGKTYLPQELLESSAIFDTDSQEMVLMQRHPIDSAKILTDLNMPPIAINMAHYHHVKADTSLRPSYPKVKNYDQVEPMTRLLAIVDMFQALVGGRPYKRSWHASDAMAYIDRLSGIECDTEVWTAFRETLGWYPVGSLIQLTEGSQAFVIEDNFDNLDRPMVAVTRNSFDEELTHNTFIDLNTEKDIFIEKGLDPFLIYGDQAIDKFTQLQVS